jgi:hypothetical protein
MGWKIKILAFALGLLFFGVVLRCVKQNTFRPRYAVLWLGMSLFLLSIAVLEPFYKWLATSVIGILDARHIIYIVLIGFLLIYNLYITAMMSRMANQIQQLITNVAILQSEKTAPSPVPNAPSTAGTPAAETDGRSKASPESQAPTESARSQSSAA